MGCFDTVVLRCPECDHINQEQSKAGRQIMATYTLDEAPLEIVADLMRESLFCEQCGEEYGIRPASKFLTAKLDAL